MQTFLVIGLLVGTVGACQMAESSSVESTAGTIIFRAEVIEGVTKEEARVSFDTGYQTVWFGPAHKYHLKFATQVVGSRGMPAIHFEIVDQEAREFSDFTASIVNSRMAIEIDGRIVCVPNVHSRLPGGGVVTGGIDGLTEEELERYLSVLNGNG